LPHEPCRAGRCIPTFEDVDGSWSVRGTDTAFMAAAARYEVLGRALALRPQAAPAQLSWVIDRGGLRIRPGERCCASEPRAHAGPLLDPSTFRIRTCSEPRGVGHVGNNGLALGVKKRVVRDATYAQPHMIGNKPIPRSDPHGKNWTTPVHIVYQRPFTGSSLKSDVRQHTRDERDALKFHRASQTGRDCDRHHRARRVPTSHLLSQARSLGAQRFVFRFCSTNLCPRRSAVHGLGLKRLKNCLLASRVRGIRVETSDILLLPSADCDVRAVTACDEEEAPVDGWLTGMPVAVFSSQRDEGQCPAAAGEVFEARRANRSMSCKFVWAPVSGSNETPLTNVT
ncbi:hypothetical protein GGX14DRAFT_596066, partial [Mycena pura]